MARTPSNRDISAQEGARITKEAQTWKDTPYKLVGAGSIKGQGADCSGSTWRIYETAGFPFEYQATSQFVDYVAKKARFRELGPNEQKQEGDLLFWSDHMAIYSGFDADKADATTARTTKKGQHWTQSNDMWTATHPGGHAYEAGNISFFKGGTQPRVFRYQK